MQESALLQAYREHEWELQRFLARRLGSVHLASDIAHDLYLKLLGVTDHSEIRDRKAYVFGMAANLATDHLRVEGRRGVILAESGGTVWQQSDELTPERHALARAELRHLETVIAELPERCRQVFHLHRYEDRTQAEIAAILGLGATTVYRDLRLVMATLLRARRRFQAVEPDADSDAGTRGK
jgi:RNA polymerase sigma factor (sigma-70 family)